MDPTKKLSSEEPLLAPKIEPIDVEFIKTEEFEEEEDFVPGITESIKIDKYSIKEEAEICSSSNVCINFMLSH